MGKKCSMKKLLDRSIIMANAKGDISIVLPEKYIRKHMTDEQSNEAMNALGPLLQHLFRLTPRCHKHRNQETSSTVSLS